MPLVLNFLMDKSLINCVRNVPVSICMPLVLNSPRDKSLNIDNCTSKTKKKRMVASMHSLAAELWIPEGEKKSSEPLLFHFSKSFFKALRHPRRHPRTAAAAAAAAAVVASFACVGVLVAPRAPPPRVPSAQGLLYHSNHSAPPNTDSYVNPAFTRWTVFQLSSDSRHQYYGPSYINHVCYRLSINSYD